MTESLCIAAISPLRQRLLDDMAVRRFSRETQRNYLRDVGRFATFLGRSPHTATVEDVRQFQIAQNAAGMPTPTMNAIVSALRFFFTQTLDRPDLARKLVQVAQPRNLPVVLSRDEVARLLNATVCLKHQAALSVAYGQACGWPRSPLSRSVISTASACCSGSNGAKGGDIATPCFRQTFCPCCGSGGRPDASRA